MLIYEVLKIRDFSKLLRLLFATLQPLLRDPPVGNHCLIESDDEIAGVGGPRAVPENMTKTKKSQY